MQDMRKLCHVSPSWSWCSESQPSVKFKALPQHLGKAAEHVFLQEEWKFPETVLKDKDHQCLTEPLGRPQDCFLLLLGFDLSLLFHFPSVSSRNHNLTLLTSPQRSSPSIRKGSHRGISMECSQQKHQARNQSRAFLKKKIINFQSISTWISRTSHFLTAEQPRKVTRGLSAAEKPSNGNN